MIYILIAIIIRTFFIYNKNYISEWVQINAPRWMGSCNFCLAYNFGIIEGIFIGFFIYDIFT